MAIDTKELDKKDINEIYDLWNDKSISAEDKKEYSDYMQNRLDKAFASGDIENFGVYELTAAAKIVGDKYAKKDILVNTLALKYNEVSKDGNLSDLQRVLRQNALIEALDVFGMTMKGTSKADEVKKVENQLKVAIAAPDSISNEDIHDFDKADKVDTLEGVDKKLLEQFRAEITKMSKFRFVDGKIVATNDSVLAKALYVKGYDAFAKVKGNVVFKERTKDKDGKETVIDVDKAKSKLYLEQLKQDAALRATYDLLSDKEFFNAYRILLSTKDTATIENLRKQIQEKFQEKVAENFKRSLVLARLATLNNKDVQKNLLIDQKTGKAVYFKNGKYIDILEAKEAEILKAIEDVEDDNKELELHPYTVGMDKYDLDLETAKVDQVLKSKNFKEKVQGKLGWLGYVKEGVKTTWKAIRKDWRRSARRLLTGMAIVGGSAALISTGFAPVVIAGGLTYIAYGVANAKITPIYDHVMAKLKLKHGDNWKKLSRKERRQAIKENWAASKAELTNNKKFQARSNFRSGEAVVAGIASSAMAFVAGPLGARYARQFVLFGGKSALAGKTAIDRNKAKQEYLKQGNRTVAAYKEIQDLNRQLSQDLVNVGAVMAGAAYVDSGAAGWVHAHTLGLAMDSFAEHNPELASKVDSFVDKLTPNKDGSHSGKHQSEASADDNNQEQEQSQEEVQKTPEQIEQEEREARWADNKTKLLQEAGDNDNFGTDPSKFDGYTLKMYNATGKFSTAQHDTWLQNFADGKIDSRPEGMSPMQYIRAYELLKAFGHDAKGHPDAEVIKAIELELNCDQDYVPTPEMTAHIHEVLGKVVFENKTRLVVIQKGDCLVEYNEAGHMGYMDAAKCGYKEVTLADGRHAITKDTLTINRIKSMEVVRIDCDGKTVHVTKAVDVREMPCEKEQVNEVHQEQEVIIQTTPKAVPPHFDVAETASGRVYAEFPEQARELSIWTNEGSYESITRAEAVASFQQLHPDVAAIIASNEHPTAEQLDQIHNDLGGNSFLGKHGFVTTDQEHPENSTVTVTVAWNAKGERGAGQGPAEMTYTELYQGLNGNNTNFTAARELDGPMTDQLLAKGNFQHIDGRGDGMDHYSTGLNDRSGNPVYYSQTAASRVTSSENGVALQSMSDEGCCYTVLLQDGRSAEVNIEVGAPISVTDAKTGSEIIIDPRDRGSVEKYINQNLASLDEGLARRLGVVNLNPPADSVQAAAEHSQYPDLVPFTREKGGNNGTGNSGQGQSNYHPGAYGPGGYYAMANTGRGGK